MPKLDLTNWLPKQEAADRLGVSVRSIERMVEAKTIKAALRPTPGKKAITVIDPAEIGRLAGMRRVQPGRTVSPGPLFLSLSEAAMYTGLAETTLQGLMISGKLPFQELEEGLRLRRRDLDAL